MPTGTMTSKGQITVPKDVREAMGLTPGTRVDFTLVDGSWVLSAEPASITELFGALGRYAGARPVALEAMDAAIAAGASDSDTA